MVVVVVAVTMGAGLLGIFPQVEWGERNSCATCLSEFYSSYSTRKQRGLILFYWFLWSARV